MREILFRGKRIDNGEWVYGGLLQSEIDVNKIAVKCQIHERFADSFSITANDVDPKSVGEFTGLKDKNGKEIYEGDIIEATTIFPNDHKIIGQVYFDSRGIWMAKEIHHEYLETEYLFELTKQPGRTEIIGNIHEHPELLAPSFNRPWREKRKEYVTK